MELTLKKNSLKGCVPEELGLLTELRTIDLEGNPDIVGKVPNALGNLAYLESCLLNGTGIQLPSGIAAKVTNRDEVIRMLRSIGGGVLSKDRPCLAQLYAAWGGCRWRKNTNWCSNLPLHEWFGVTVDANGRVASLYLGANELAGPMARGTALEGLKKLTKLSLFGNYLSGPVGPSLAKLTSLVYLDLEENCGMAHVDSPLECRGDGLRKLYKALGIDGVYEAEVASERAKVLTHPPRFDGGGGW